MVVVTLAYRQFSTAFTFIDLTAESLPAPASHQFLDIALEVGL